jgi:hypothetical protein
MERNKEGSRQREIKKEMYKERRRDRKREREVGFVPLKSRLFTRTKRTSNNVIRLIHPAGPDKSLTMGQ